MYNTVSLPASRITTIQLAGKLTVFLGEAEIIQFVAKRTVLIAIINTFFGSFYL